MTQRGRQLLGAIAAALVAACGRARPPASPPSPADTARRATVDTLRPKADTTLAPPGTPGAVTPAPPGTGTGKKAESTQRCVLDFENTAETHAQSVEVDTVRHKRVTYVAGGILGRCRGQAITIISDSAELYEQNALYILIGNVHYREPRASIDAQRVTYYRAEERFLFENNVHVVSQDSTSVMTGSRAEYYRAVQGIRPRTRLVATQRPHLTYLEKDSLGRPQPPVTLDANTIVGEGDSTYFASGSVVLLRTDILARGDSGYVDAARKYSRIMRKPVIESRGRQPFTLTGRVIDLFGASRQVDRILSLDSAKAVSKDLTLVSDTIDLRVADNLLNRAYAFGPEGATATTAERTIVADSLDIVMPAQRIRELHAIGKAYVESDPDTAALKTDERDWLRGDTIVARFDSIAKADTTSRPQLRDVVASGSASSFYQMQPNQSNKPPAKNQPAQPKREKPTPAISYARGRVIHLQFAKIAGGTKEGLETVTIEDQASGLYLEPESDSTKTAQAKSRGARPGTNAPRKPPVLKPPTTVRRPPAP